MPSSTSKEIMEIFDKLNREGLTVVVVTHSSEIAGCARRLIQIKDGEILYDRPMY